jgi:hypothetical protein
MAWIAARSSSTSDAPASSSLEEMKASLPGFDSTGAALVPLRRESSGGRSLTGGAKSARASPPVRTPVDAGRTKATERLRDGAGSTYCPRAAGGLELAA